VKNKHQNKKDEKLNNTHLDFDNFIHFWYFFFYVFFNSDEGLLLSKENSRYSEISDWDSYLKEIMTKIESHIPEKYLKAKGWR